MDRVTAVPEPYGQPVGLVCVEPLLSHRLSNEGGLNLPCLVE